MLENQFQAIVIRELKEMFPHAVVKKFDPTHAQGFPDLLILFDDGRWACLECKKGPNEHHQPNQDRWVEMLNSMSFAAFIHPENKREVYDALQRSFKA